MLKVVTLSSETVDCVRNYWKYREVCIDFYLNNVIKLKKKCLLIILSLSIQLKSFRLTNDSIALKVKVKSSPL